MVTSTEDRSAQIGVASFGSDTDPGQRQVLGSPVRHLHAFVEDEELADEEWEAAIAFPAGRRPNRPAHLHLLVNAHRHRSLGADLFVKDCPCLGSDVAFGVRASLVRDFGQVDDLARAPELGFDNPNRAVHLDITLLGDDGQEAKR